jgi:hypothetical protein
VQTTSSPYILCLSFSNAYFWWDVVIANTRGPHVHAGDYNATVVNVYEYEGALGYG